MASELTGVKKLIKLPSGSRKSKERFPHGMVVGSWTTSVIIVLSFRYSPSTSPTRNSMIAVWLSAGRAAPAPNMAMVLVLPMCDLAQNRIEGGEGASARHVRTCVRIAKHRFEGVATAPLRIIDDVSAVQTGVNIRGDEPRQMAHRVLCGLEQHVGE